MKQDYRLAAAFARCGRWTATSGFMLAISASILNAAGTTTARADTCAKMMDVKIQEWTGDIINIVPWVADDQGMFRKHCLNVHVRAARERPRFAMRRWSSGTINFANGAPDGIMRSRARGVDLRLVGNMYAAQWSALVGQRTDWMLPHAKDGYPAIMHDLVGKKIGVTVLGGTTEAYVRSCI